MPSRNRHRYQPVIADAFAEASTLTMVSEHSVAEARSDFPGGDLNSWRSSLKFCDRSRSDHQWQSDSGNPGDDSYLCKNQVGESQFKGISDRQILLESNCAAPISAPRSFGARFDRIQEAGFKTQEVGSRSCGNLWREASIQGDGDDGKIDGRQVFDEMSKRHIEMLARNRHRYQPVIADAIAETWEHWRNGTALEIIDPSMGEIFSSDEVLRCIQVGLLCTLEAPTERPTMSSVFLMLHGPSMALQEPLQPRELVWLTQLRH